MKKFYVEIYVRCGNSPYILQSQWFSTAATAKNWAKKIRFLEEGYAVDIMAAEFNGEGEYGDIEVYENVRN